MANLEHEIQKCDKCRLINEDVAFDGPTWFIKNGFTFGVPGVGVFPLWSDFALCAPHEARAQQEWGG